jgi:hypothetical protein
LKRLPQTCNSWEADVRPLPFYVEEGGRRIRPWMLLIIDPAEGLVLGQELGAEPPPTERLWDKLAQVMERPMSGERHRPGQLYVGADPRWAPLRADLLDIGITLVMDAKLDRLTQAFERLAAHVCPGREPGLLDTPGVTPELVRGFYDAAAHYYMQAPWKAVRFEVPLRIECKKFESGPWYAIVMGQSKLAYGLALYEDLDVLRKILRTQFSDQETARESVALVVIYGEESDIPIADLEAGRREGWPISAANAYPVAHRKERGMVMRQPLAWELELLEACLRAVPEFVTRHSPGDTQVETSTVRTAAGKLALTLQWTS